MTLRAELRAVVDELLRAHPEPEIELDVIGEAIGARAVSQDEIDGVLSAVEAAGRKIVSRAGGSGEAHLKVVLDAARVLRRELGRPPRPDEIAARAGIEPVVVQHALALAKVMQR